jgi:hypothetical protein
MKLISTSWCFLLPPQETTGEGHGHSSPHPHYPPGEVCGGPRCWDILACFFRKSLNSEEEVRKGKSLIYKNF